jgi:signal transduction histidine kinase/DNA-binding response OmpR family regulator
LKEIPKGIFLIGMITLFLSVVAALLAANLIKRPYKEMERLREAAVDASKAKSTFLATMSHEIRTPMNAILGISEIQLQNQLLTPSMRDAFDKIYNAADLLLGIINDILDMSKIEAGKLELMPAEYEVASLINDTVQLNVMRIGSKPVEIELHVDENTPSTVSGDALRVKQILNNVLSNAFKYTAKGVVKLSVFHETGDVAGPAEPEVTLVFRVSDTGYGMTPDQVSRLFDEYARFNLEAHPMAEGTGLGMSITRNLIRLMNGDIVVESEPGRGSTFIVRLPQGNTGSRALGRELAENLRQFRLGAAMYMKRAQIIREPMPYGRVLVVDDVETNIYVATGLLAPYGLTVEHALSGFAAIEKIKQGNAYDIVFMDHMMPEMDGIEATTAIRDLGYTRPVVALTANAVIGQAEMFLEKGFDDFISKPIDIRLLNSLLNKYIRDRQPPEVVEAVRREKISVPGHADAIPQPSAALKLAKVFTRDASRSIAALEAICEKQGVYEDEDIQAYIINVHGMRSALANMGELELSSLALRLEQAARERDAAVMSSDTPAFMNALRAVVKKIAPREDGEDSEITDADRAYLREQLMEVKAACEAYDKKTAKNALAGIEQKTSWPRPTRDLLDTIARHLLHSKFKEIVNIVDKAL